ncbi:MAG: hypothetical protein JSR73_04965 [Proteobacteria bacterium]|nr:hypothetical protein [Pseudomonadota bacterium]
MHTVLRRHSAVAIRSAAQREIRLRQLSDRRPVRAPFVPRGSFLIERRPSPTLPETTPSFTATVEFCDAGHSSAGMM